jgi:predicted transcriptional regulator
MPQEKKVKDFMIPLEDYPHIPYWFTLRQAMAIVREASIKFEGSFEPRAVLVFDEKYQLMGMLTLRDIVRGLEPRFLKDSGLIKADPSLTVLLKEALALMILENVGMMPVMQNQKVVGMVRMNELFQEISKIVLGD